MIRHHSLAHQQIGAPALQARRLARICAALLLACVFVAAVTIAAYAQGNDTPTPLPADEVEHAATLAETSALTLTSALSESVETPLLAAPTIPYTPTFAEIECPFVPPWSQTLICGALTVPEVRTDPDTNFIELFVIILKSHDAPLIDPIVVLAGGPGGAISQSRSNFYALPSRDHRDLILVDPRGTGQSRPSLNCFEAEAVGVTYADSVEATRACHERLLAEGHDLAGYVTEESVEDIADLAKVLGIGKINLYATSYGSRVAVLLADKYPMLVRSMVLDAVLPVSVNSLLEEPLNTYGVFRRVAQDCAADARCNGNHPALEPRLLEIIDRYNREPLPDDIGYGSGDDILQFLFKQLYQGGRALPAFITALYYEDFESACALMPPATGCFFAEDGSTTDSAQSGSATGLPRPSINTLPAEVAARLVYTWEMPTLSVVASDALLTQTTVLHPLPAVQPWRAFFTNPEDPLSPDVDRISWLMHEMGYARPAQLFEWLDTLDLAEVVTMLHGLPGAQNDSFSEGGFASVICSEEAPFFSMADIRELGARIPVQFGSLPTQRALEVKAVCEFWDVPAISAARKVTLPSSVPTLITNGTHDPITPPLWARRAAIYLDKVWVHLFPGYGHAILGKGDPCMQQMVDLFYDDPTTDPLPACYNALQLDFIVVE